MVQELTDESFEKAINGQLPVIVDFWASWCGPCRMMAPVFEKLSETYKGKLDFAKISTEDYPDPAVQNSVQGIPCLIVFHKGEEVGRIVGFAPESMLKSKIDDVLGKIK